MASFRLFISSLLLLSLVFLSYLSFIAGDDAYRTHVCSISLNPTLCMKCFNYNEHSLDADLLGLTHITLDCARAVSVDSQADAGALRGAEKEPALKRVFEDCYNLIDKVGGIVVEARIPLGNRDYPKAKNMVTNAAEESSRALNLLKDYTVVPSLKKLITGLHELNIYSGIASGFIDKLEAS